MTTTPRTPRRVRDVLPGLRGQGVLLAASSDGRAIEQALTAAGFGVAQAELASPAATDRAHPGGMPDAPASLRTAQAAIASALRLPETAGHNLDALIDSLRDLATWWPGTHQLALLLHGAESLVDHDLPGWHTLTEILAGATAELWRGGGPGDVAFETVALVAQHGVPHLPNRAPEGPDQA